MAQELPLALEELDLPLSCVRALESTYATQARADFERYVRRTLHFSQRLGGRFNPPCEFGALYTASDESTAFAELHARFQREGIPGLPPTMGMLRIVVDRARYVDFLRDASRRAWHIEERDLRAESPSTHQVAKMHAIGMNVRAVADLLRVPSARGAGQNIPLFVVGRDEDGLSFRLVASHPYVATPLPLTQRATGDRWPRSPRHLVRPAAQRLRCADNLACPGCNPACRRSIERFGRIVYRAAGAQSTASGLSTAATTRLRARHGA